MLRLDFASRGFYVLRSAVLQTGGASAVFAGRDFSADFAAWFSNCDFMNRRHGIILRIMDFTDCGFTNCGFAFARRVLILSHDAVLRAVLRRIVDYPQHLRAAALFENI